MDNMDSRTVIKISDLLKERGFLRPTTDPLVTAAILRGDKTAVVLDGFFHVNKGDYLVFKPVKPPLDSHDICSDLNDMVFEVTDVSPVPNSNPIQQLVCFRKVCQYVFHEGQPGSNVHEDSLGKRTMK